MLFAYGDICFAILLPLVVILTSLVMLYYFQPKANIARRANITRSVISLVYRWKWCSFLLLE